MFPSPYCFFFVVGWIPSQWFTERLFNEVKIIPSAGGLSLYCILVRVCVCVCVVSCIVLFFFLKMPNPFVRSETVFIL